ncbi:MAG: phosphatase PAP2 family protein [Sphaerochaetaceae bacterium]|nr:phosphatase PAP2 family protein [Sphaerochaetaceae bacterium]
MAIQESIIIFASNAYNVVADKIATFISLFGTSYVLIPVMVILYWALDKKKGYVAGATFLTANSVNNTIKSIVKFPRPWMVLSDRLGQRDVHATGYSFPSGHSCSSASLYGSIANLYRKKWLSIVCITLIILVGVSRVYLCVHWPLDVICGLAIGFICVWLLNALFARVYDDDSLFMKVNYILGAVTAVGGVVTGLLLDSGKYEIIQFKDLCQNLEFLAGALVGYALERKTCCFIIEEGNVLKKIIRVVIGAVGAVALMLYFKKLMALIGLEYTYLAYAVNYFVIGLWCAWLWPLIGKKVKLFA